MITPIVVVAGLVSVLIYLASSHDVPVLNPQGAIGAQQRDLLLVATGLMLLVVIPVFAMTFIFAWKYRAGNTAAKYEPDWDHSRTAETLWWGIPFAIIAVLATIAWVTSHTLDPYRALTSDVKPVRIQVVALQWKWLFLYPDEGIATVNNISIPVDTPVSFEITSDAPMNSFWIPSLGGQIYAMSGMSTRLHLIANEAGIYRGSSANISGEGFAGMKFTATASTAADYRAWVDDAKHSRTENLTLDEYNELSEPSVNNKPQTFSGYQSGLYDTIIMKYMGHGGTHGH